MVVPASLLLIFIFIVALKGYRVLKEQDGELELALLLDCETHMGAILVSKCFVIKLSLKAMVIVCAERLLNQKSYLLNLLY